jgi:RNA polymerase sigma-70 factor (ECF subfamily)
MSSDLTDTLLARLVSGAEDADQVFRAYEPYLRTIVRRQLSVDLRSRFDSMDVVQSVWVDLLEGFRAGRWQFPDGARFRAFLVTMTRNRFLERVRQAQRARQHEQPLPDGQAEQLPASSEPRPSEVAQAGELWERLLILCPPAHRELLRMKRDGLSLNEIAAQSGMHPSSIRRIFYDLARRLRPD